MNHPVLHTLGTRWTRRRLVAAGAALLALRHAPARAEDGWIVGVIYAAAARYGVSGDWMLSVARCESNLDPSAVGPNGEISIFQFMPSTWYAWGGGDIWSVYEQADMAARAFARGDACAHWVCAHCPGGLTAW